VVRLLDWICEYYERHEPSSPLPLLLARCKRLVSASFLDIVRDVAPGAVSQVDILRGKDNQPEARS
jgi:type VI secretion system protein ImpA